jgi:hypothetical protein
MRDGTVGQRRSLESIDVSDVGVVERREDLGLPLEACQPLRVGGECCGQDLDREREASPRGTSRLRVASRPR